MFMDQEQIISKNMTPKVDTKLISKQDLENLVSKVQFEIDIRNYLKFTAYVTEVLALERIRDNTFDSEMVSFANEKCSIDKKRTPQRKNRGLSLPELETQISDNQSPQIEFLDPINKLMASEDKYGFNLIEQCMNILFEDGDEMYVMFLLSNVPNINKYLHQINNNTGWLPIFRVLNFL